jgi:hypothetical protein
VTVIDHLVVRLHGDEDWEAWGDKWWDHIDKVGELHWVGHSAGPFPSGPERQLDWGAFLTEATCEEVRGLAWVPPWLADSDWARQQRAMLERLSPTERYGVIAVEMA